MKALLVDAFDSFAHIIYQYLEIAGVETDVVRSGELSPAEVVAGDHDFVLLGPGPGTPEDSGHVELVQALAGVKPVLGVCLGHQAIAVAFGGTVGRVEPMHGKTSRIEHDGLGVFAGREPLFTATRYHSLAVAADSLPAELIVTARAEGDGAVMGIRHAELPIEGVQFHPESVLTQEGLQLFRNFLDRVPVAV